MTHHAAQFTKTGFSRLEIKEVDESAHTFVGLASTWDLDLGGDIIRKGAFKRTLKNWKDSKRSVPLVDSHDIYTTVTKVVGKMEHGEETDEGLLAEFSMIPDDQMADAVFKRVAGGFVDGLSIGYRAVKVEYPKTEEERKRGVYRYLDEVKLQEVSVVMYPMNPAARIDLSSAKHLVDLAGRRDLSEDEVKELAALHAAIADVLTGAEKVEGGDGGALPSPGETAIDEEAAKALADRIDAMMANRLATRLADLQHSGRVLVDL